MKLKMIPCTFCKKNNKNNSRFCTKCGKNLNTHNAIDVKKYRHNKYSKITFHKLYKTMSSDGITKLFLKTLIVALIFTGIYLYFTNTPKTNNPPKHVGQTNIIKDTIGIISNLIQTKNQFKKNTHTDPNNFETLPVNKPIQNNYYIPHVKYGPFLVAYNQMIRVDINSACNVFSIPSFQYENYVNGLNYNYYGGYYQNTPVFIKPPAGSYYLVLDQAGKEFYMNARVLVVNQNH